jgi:hypothetical protein
LLHQQETTGDTEMTTKTISTNPVTAKELAKMFGIAPQTRSASKRHYGDAFRYINREIEVYAGRDLPYELWIMILGVQWARSTSRLHANAEFALRAMTPYQYLHLLVELASQFNTMGEVPYYLNEKW